MKFEIQENAIKSYSSYFPLGREFKIKNIPSGYEGNHSLYLRTTLEDYPEVKYKAVLVPVHVYTPPDCTVTSYKSVKLNGQLIENLAKRSDREKYFYLNVPKQLPNCYR